MGLILSEINRMKCADSILKFLTWQDQAPCFLHSSVCTVHYSGRCSPVIYAATTKTLTGVMLWYSNTLWYKALENQGKLHFDRSFHGKLIWKGCREEGVFRNSSWEEPWNLFIFRISPIKPLMVKSFIPLQSISRWLFNSYAKANQIILTIKDKINTFCNLSSRRSLTCTISI